MQIKHLKNLLIIMVSTLFIWACSSTRHQISRPVSGKQTVLMDSILQEGLDGEALYTLLGNIKPMSSVVSFTFPLGNADSAKQLDGDIVYADSLKVYQKRLEEIQQAINHINIPDIKLVMVPYRSPYRKTRVLQVNAIRISALDSLLKARAPFFAQFGLVPGADPAVVLTVNEYENRYERLRGYGYLFGYPDYAVDFFVKAFHQSDTSGKHVERNFFNIPTYRRAGGQFVYAYPKTITQPSAIDSALYKRSTVVLEKYKEKRNHYLNSDSTLRAYELILDYLHQKR